MEGKTLRMLNYSEMNETFLKRMVSLETRRRHVIPLSFPHFLSFLFKVKKVISSEEIRFSKM